MLSFCLILTINPKNINKARPNDENIKNELHILCKNDLSGIKQPTHIIELEELPKATYGKIQKNKIKSWVIQNKNHLTKKHKTIQTLNFIKKMPTYFLRNKFIEKFKKNTFFK